MIPIFLLLSAMAPLNDDETTATGPEDSVLVRYDLSSMMPTFDGAGFEETMLLSAGNAHGRYARTDFEEMYESASADVVVELVTRLLSEEFEYEGREIHLHDGDELLVLAPPELQTKVRATLEAVETAFSAHAELRIDVLRLPGDGPAPFGGANVVDVSQLAGLPSGGPGQVRESYTMRILAGRTSVLEIMREIPLVADYDIEIAQGSLIHDPIIGIAEEGMRLYLRGAPVGGGLALSVYYTHGDALSDEPVTKQIDLQSLVASDDGSATYVVGPSMYEEIEVLFRSLAFNTTLQAGKALVFSSQADLNGAKSRQVVVIRQTGGGLDRFYSHVPAGSRRELFLINAEALHPPEVTTHGRLRDDRSDSTRHVPSLVAQLRSEPSLFLYDWVANRFSTWRTVGPWLLCVYDPSWDGDASAQLSALLGGWREDTRLVECSVSVNSRGHGGPTPVSWSVPLRPGSPCAAMIGVSSTMLADYDVEVAQRCAGADPQHVPVFNGMVFVIESAYGNSGNLGLDLRASVHLRRGELREIDLGGPLIARLEAATYDHMRVIDRLSVPAGSGRTSFQLGGQATSDDGAMQLQVEVR